MSQDVKRARILKDGWLGAYNEYIIRHEAPDIFHFWVGCQMISAALKRNIYIDRGAYQVWPNQYIFLIAKSGGCKKGAAIKIGLDLIQGVEAVKILYGRMTVEGLIDEMDRATLRPDGKIAPDGSVLIHADELSYLFGKASYIGDLITFFTAAYVSNARLDFLTRGHGTCVVRNPCPSILAGTTPEQMGEIFPSMTLASGFMARVLMIYGIRGERVAEPRLKNSMQDALIHDLGCISELYGEIKLTEEAKTIFKTWYENLGMAPHNELEAFYERKHDHVLKAAIILSVSESDSMIITKMHLAQALAVIENIEARIPDAIAHIGATTASNIADKIVAIIRSIHPEPVSHSVLMRRIYKNLTYGKDEFKSIIELLKESERITEIASQRGVFYALRGKK